MSLQNNNTFNIKINLDRLVKTVEIFNGVLYGDFISQKKGNIHRSVILENDELIFIGENCNIKAGVVLDATNGPIIIDKDAVINHGSVIEGPTYIGKQTVINPNSLILA